MKNYNGTESLVIVLIICLAIFAVMFTYKDKDKQKQSWIVAKLKWTTPPTERELRLHINALEQRVSALENPGYVNDSRRLPSVRWW